MAISTLFFDLDDTLYPSGNGLWEAIRERMNLYMVERLGLSETDVPALRKHYYETYGTTLRGLQLHYRIDPDDFLAYVHDLPLPSYLTPDLPLRDILLSLPGSKWIFTNADAGHANRVLAVLGLRDCFQGIIDIRATGFACKPELAAYRRALSLAGETNPRHCILFDDAIRNLAPAHEMGFYTVWVGSDNSDPAACWSLCSLHRLKEVLPELWGKMEHGI